MPAKTLQIPTADGQSDAFAAFPDRDGRHPGVLLYPDAFGVRPVLREMARELAGHGYYVLVPNLYYRHGPAPATELPELIGEEIRPAVFARLLPLIEAHTTERILRDADAYLRFLTAQPEAGAGPAAGKTVPRRNLTDPDSRLVPVRGGGFIQGYNCQDAAAGDRLMPGGYACQDTGDVLQHSGWPPSRPKAPPSSRPATPPAPPAPPGSRPATTGCAPCPGKTGTTPVMTSPPAMQR